MSRRAARRLLAAVAMCLPVTASAQIVTGRMHVGAGGAPLVGAHVSLLAEDGATVASSVSGPDGGFSLSAPGPGVYTVRGEHVGHVSAVSTVRLDETDLGITLTTEAVSIPLDGLSTEMDRPCRVDPVTRERIAALWAETSKALRVAVLVQSQGGLGYEIETWYRQLDPRRLHVVEEDRTPRAGFHPTARFTTPPAEDLAKDGFVQGGRPGESLAFYGPDAGTLTSAAFIATHCFGFAADAPEENQVGLRFRPLDEDAKDVEGTLWIDAATYEPRALEYRFTELPWPVKTDKVGGRMEFRRLSTGALIVHRWWMRMPRVGVRQERITQWAEPRDRFTLTAVVEEGGVIVRVRTPDGRIEETR